MTAGYPGAIAIVQLVGDVVPVLQAVTGIDRWPIGQLRLVDMKDIDEGLAVRLRDDVAQLMPHGGMRVVQRLMAQMAELQVSFVAPESIDPKQLYPEADDGIEAIMLRACACATSPLALAPLLAQPRNWREHARTLITDAERERSIRLNRLLAPPLVVLVGPPNVGKSTLSNILLGRSMSLAVDMPGTTRDYTVALIELGGLVVQWHDTPGIRQSSDPIEMEAIEISRQLIDRADLLIALTDSEHDWPAPHSLGRTPDLRVANKSDIGRLQGADFHVSALTGEGIAELVQQVREILVPQEDLHAVLRSRWVFAQELAALPSTYSPTKRP